MRKAIVITMSLLMIGMMVASTCAFSIPSGLSALGLSGLSTPTMSSNLGSASLPANNLEVSTPNTAFGNSDWALNGMKFFQPSSAKDVVSNSGTGIPSSDVIPIMELMSQLPSPEQVQQANNPTPTPTPVNTFTSVSGEVPADQFVFIEVSKNTVYTDASSGFKVPTVTMNYQFDEANKKLTLKNRNGTDYNGAKVIVGYTRQNDVDGSYLFDYNIGSIPYDDIPIVFTGADGRVSIVINGTQKDLMPGEKVESTTKDSNTMTSITVSNYGLLPKANIQVKEKL